MNKYSLELKAIFFCEWYCLFLFSKTSSILLCQEKFQL